MKATIIEQIQNKTTKTNLILKVSLEVAEVDDEDEEVADDLEFIVSSWDEFLVELMAAMDARRHHIGANGSGCRNKPKVTAMRVPNWIAKAWE